MTTYNPAEMYGIRDIFQLIRVFMYNKNGIVELNTEIFVSRKNF